MLNAKIIKKEVERCKNRIFELEDLLKLDIERKDFWNLHERVTDIHILQARINIAEWILEEDKKSDDSW